MADHGLENLLANLRRQATMSPHQQQQPGGHSQQQQQSPIPQGHMYPHSPPPMESVQQPPFHPFPHPQFHSESPVYSPLHQPQNSAPGFASVPDNSFSGFHKPPPPQPQTQAPEPAKQQQSGQANHSSTSLQPPYNLPMSPSASNIGENRTASLLSLLKFSQAVPLPASPSSEQAPPPKSAPTPPRPAVNSPPPLSQTQQPTPHTRSISASDLVATLFARPTDALNTSKENVASSASASPVQQHSPVQQRSATTESVPQHKPPINPQDLVFQLLGRPKPVQEPQTAPQRQETSPVADEGRQLPTESSMPPPPQVHTSNGPSRALPSVLMEVPTPSQTPSKGLFTYVNPFEQLSATSPRNRTPKSATPGPGAGRKSALGTTEMRAEDFPLPGSAPVSPAPPAPAEAEAVKEVAALDQTKDKERQLMEQLDQHAEQYVSKQAADELPLDYEQKLQIHAERPAIADEPVSNVGQPDINSSSVLGVSKQDSRDGEEEGGYESAPEIQSIEVYNFPMKPFSSITIVPSAIKRTKYPTSKISDVARMTRTFDQLDRNLIASTHTFIAYSLSKSNGRGGIRIIRQYDGKDRVIMKDSSDRTFNIAVGRGERVLGTGVSGAVVWVDLMEDFDTEGWNSMFVFPPSEEQGQSNGVLKSRARKTSRQVDAFAIGRGKTISIIHAPAARAYAEGRKGNVVASKKYLAEHARTIDTGKASKDFAFSDDDSVIISIDKAGKLKFWDVRELLNFSENDAYDMLQKTYRPQPPMVLSMPSLIFSAVAAGETYRATSVMFLDKFRPYLKCMALRYVIVGMKQNHTLQLWDLALGRPVQEINFPQESDTDALCSVVYHPLSGIIVVGNPTRNSIYFIHLSAPKYNLPMLSQAEYIHGIANKHSAIPKPDATAILSGLREYSFATKGQLMSLDILDYESDPQEDNPVLFELYVSHSKGMTTLSVFKEDLGWEPDNRVKNAVDAVARGVCTLTSMPPPPPPEREKERDDKSETTEASGQALKPKSDKNKSRSVSPATGVSEKNDTGEDRSGANVGPGKKKKKDKASATVSAATTSGTDEPKAMSATTKAKVSGSGTSSAQNSEQELNVPAGFLDREVKRIEQTVSTEFTKVISRELEQLYRRFDDDRRIQQASGDAKQDAILRLLSSTLTDNVEQVISRIVMTNIQAQVVPAIAEVTASSITRTLGETLNRSLSVSLPHELRTVVPDAINRALSQLELLGRLSDSLMRPLTQAVELEFSHSLHNTMIPAFQKLAVEAAQKAVIETERKHSDTISALEQMHRDDSRKIDRLLGFVNKMSEKINNIAKSQADFQEQVQQAQAEYYEHGVHSQSHIPVPEKSPEQLEAEEIENLLRSGRYEDGTIKWLQSKERQAELFDEVMVRYRYDFLPNLSQLVLLSVSAAVSVKFDNKVLERLSWLEGVLAVLDPMDGEIREICNRIMVVVVQRLEQLYMSSAEVNPQDPIIRKIPSIARRARELSNQSQHPHEH